MFKQTMANSHSGIFSLYYYWSKFSLYYYWSKFIGDAWVPKTCNFTLSTLYFNYTVLKRFSANKLMSYNPTKKGVIILDHSFIYFRNTTAWPNSARLSGLGKNYSFSWIYGLPGAWLVRVPQLDGWDNRASHWSSVGQPGGSTLFLLELGAKQGIFCSWQLQREGRQAELCFVSESPGQNGHIDISTSFLWAKYATWKSEEMAEQVWFPCNKSIAKGGWIETWRNRASCSIHHLHLYWFIYWITKYTPSRRYLQVFCLCFLHIWWLEDFCKSSCWMHTFQTLFFLYYPCIYNARLCPNSDSSPFPENLSQCCVGWHRGLKKCNWKPFIYWKSGSQSSCKPCNRIKCVLRSTSPLLDTESICIHCHLPNKSKSEAKDKLERK